MIPIQNSLRIRIIKNALPKFCPEFGTEPGTAGIQVVSYVDLFLLIIFVFNAEQALSLYSYTVFTLMSAGS